MATSAFPLNSCLCLPPQLKAPSTPVEKHALHTRTGGKPPTLPSLCHPWSSGVTSWLSNTVLGVTPIEPGYTTVRLAPHVSTSYPSVNGTVWVGAGLGGGHGQRSDEVLLAARLHSPRQDPSIQLAATSPVAVELCVPMSLPLVTVRSDSAAAAPATSVLLTLILNGRAQVAPSADGGGASRGVSGGTNGGAAEFVVVQPRNADGRLLACSRSLPAGAYTLTARYERRERTAALRTPFASTVHIPAGRPVAASVPPLLKPPPAFGFPNAHYAYTWSLDRRQELLPPNHRGQLAVLPPCSTAPHRSALPPSPQRPLTRHPFLQHARRVARTLRPPRLRSLCLRAATPLTKWLPTASGRRVDTSTLAGRHIPHAHHVQFRSREPTRSRPRHKWRRAELLAGP